LGLLGAIALACLKIKRCVDWTFKHALGTQALRYGKPLTVIGALIGVFSLANKAGLKDFGAALGAQGQLCSWRPMTVMMHA
jgi:hypothetical protein